MLEILASMKNVRQPPNPYSDGADPVPETGRKGVRLESKEMSLTNGPSN